MAMAVACDYRVQRSCGQGNIFAPVCHSVHRGGVCSGGSVVSQHALRQTPLRSIHPPQSRHPPRADTLLPGADIPLGSDTPPGADTPLEQTPQEQTPL